MAIRTWKAALSYRARRVVAALPGMSFDRYVLVAVRVAALPPSVAAGLSMGILPPALAVAAGLAEAKAADWRARQGSACLGVWRRDALVAVTWLTAGVFDEDEVFVRFQPPPGAAWDTGMTIAPAARGGRAFAALWAATRAWAEPLGLRWSISRIADYNLASRRAHARLGAVEIGRVSVLRFGNRQWAGGAVPRFARLDGARPVVRLQVPE